MEPFKRFLYLHIFQDLKNAKSIVDWIAWAEPQYNFNPMIDEWCKEAPKELDFNHEAGIFRSFLKFVFDVIDINLCLEISLVYFVGDKFLDFQEVFFSDLSQAEMFSFFLVFSRLS